MSTALDYALSFNTLGYNVIPLIQMGKKPPFEWEIYQTRFSTPEEIQAWYAENPYFNVGLPTGGLSGLVVIDADSPSAVRYCTLHMEMTPFRIRSRKGIHYYYRHPGIHIPSKARIHPIELIDIRGDGGYVATIGSIHETGYVYDLAPSARIVPITDLPVYRPEWYPDKPVLSFGDKLVAMDYSKADKALGWLARQDGVVEGSRNQTAFKVAAWMIRDMEVDPDDALDGLAAWNRKNHPPLPDRELEKVVESAANGRIGRA